MLTGFCIAITLASCETVTTNQYEATVQTTLTWQVPYHIDPSNDKVPRFEEFATASLLTRNGEQPQGRFIGPDEQGLWWPILPPRPTIDEVEQRQRPQEQASPPELLRTAKYQISFLQEQRTVTLPTNYDVYRQVVRAYRLRKPLQLTLGIGDRSVEKAEFSENFPEVNQY